MWISNILIKKMCSAFDESNNFIAKKVYEYGKNKERMRCLDIGCGTGANSFKYFHALRDPEIYGIDRLDTRTSDAPIFKCSIFDLEGAKLPFRDEFFDIIVSNQVIEHILDKDMFLREVRRTLKLGGLYVVSTENISSLENIISLIMGNEPLVQHSSSKYIISSVLSPHFLKPIPDPFGNKYLHKNVLSYFSLKRLARLSGLSGFKIISFGGLPLISKLMPIYNRVILIYGIRL